MSRRTGQEREHRDDLTGEHAVGDAGQIILALLFVGAWILDSFFLRITTFPNQYVPLYIRIPIGAAILIISLIMAVKGHNIVFGEKRERPEVITKGVFGIVRHPIYLSEILLYLGAIVLSISLVAAAVWIITIFFLYYISRHEEKLLLARFGEEYERYKKETPMLVPLIRRR